MMKKVKLVLVAGIVLFAGALASASWAGGNKDTANPAKDTVSQQDKTFLDEAAQGGLAEVELSRAVKDRVVDAEVKGFAQRMVDDHGKANTDLQSLAAKQSQVLPVAMDAKHKECKERLNQLTGYALDRRYMEEMVKDHQKAVSLFEKEADKGKDMNLKQFANDTLPTLRDHLTSARSIEQKLKKMQNASR